MQQNKFKKFNIITDIALGDKDSSVIVKMLCFLSLIVFILLIGPIHIVGFLLGIRYCDECGKIIMTWKKVHRIRELSGDNKRFCTKCSKESIVKINNKKDEYYKKYPHLKGIVIGQTY